MKYTGGVGAKGTGLRISPRLESQLCDFLWLNLSLLLCEMGETPKGVVEIKWDSFQHIAWARGS